MLRAAVSSVLGVFPAKRFSQCFWGARDEAFQLRVFECNQACAGCLNGRCRGTLTAPMTSNAGDVQMVKGHTQSGGQVWDSAVVVRSRGPCNRGSIPGAHRIMFDSEMLPRRAAHAAGRRRVRFYEMRRGGCPDEAAEVRADSRQWRLRRPRSERRGKARRGRATL